MNPYIQSACLDFVNRSFRDVADQDYLAARVLYRLELGIQFLWASHQAVEKYLKAILLYNHCSTKTLGHDLKTAFRKLYLITDIPFSFPEDVAEFVKYLNDQGNNRYLEKSAYTTGKELLMLDRTVWHIRRYCYDMRIETTAGADGKRIDLFPWEVAKVKEYPVEKANRYRIRGGYLENILDMKQSEARKHLVWKNFYYGSHGKKVIKSYRFNSWSINPSHCLHPEVFALLKHRVKFAVDVKKMFSKVQCEEEPDTGQL